MKNTLSPERCIELIDVASLSLFPSFLLSLPFFFFLLYKFVYLFLAVLGPHCCTGFSVVAGSQGSSLLQCSGCPGVVPGL